MRSSSIQAKAYYIIFVMLPQQSVVITFLSSLKTFKLEKGSVEARFMMELLSNILVFLNMWRGEVSRDI